MDGLKGPLELSWTKRSAYASWHAYHNHGGNSALTMQFTLSTELQSHAYHG